MKINIRPVIEEDVKQIIDIYKPYIINTPITFEYEVPTLIEFKKRIKEVTKQFPWLICEIDNEIVGYTYAHYQHERKAYQWNAELSIYISEKYHGKKIAKYLYKCIIEILKEQGYYNLYSCITLPNDKSIGLHKAFGFSEIGVYKKTGNKFNKWYDVIWLVKNIHEYDENPKAPVSFDCINKEFIFNLFKNNSKLIEKSL